jgi:hypothetical protein
MQLARTFGMSARTIARLQLWSQGRPAKALCCERFGQNTKVKPFGISGSMYSYSNRGKPPQRRNFS